ncbi:polysaccharide deacetylase [Paenibacillus sp. Marseille-Q4541]|uniref:polysaccharide deacetylase n=1 Tax=Paenibacillus sp. Marseille-Q4541 TaxID=2831522 RepID=UPI0020192CBF|nr:polysaccharide deacetylase [Paenibacillus sp. Marseille-Q4541]
MKRLAKQNKWQNFSYKLMAGLVILLLFALTGNVVPSNVVNSEAVNIQEAVNSASVETASLAVHTVLNRTMTHSKQEKNDQSQEVRTSYNTNKNNEGPLGSKQGLGAASTSTEKSKRNKVFLTFDDGPGKHTVEVLDILDKYDVPATFFVLGQQVEIYPELINRMYENGYVIGNHTYDHEYDELYGSFPDFWNQIKQTEEAVRRITGERPQLVRAPGGTSGHFDSTYFDLMEQAGYTVTDWNVDSGDSLRKGVPAKEIIKNATKVTASGDLVVLMHDGGNHAETVKALPAIIEYYQAQQYEFASLDPAEKPVQFKVKSQGSTDKKIQPSKEWINNHIAPNRALFGAGPSLVIEAGKLVTKLAPGEYQEKQDQLLVPLRVIVERYGGTVKWNGADRIATATWAGNEIKVNPDKQLLAGEEGRVEMKSGAIWVSLRDLLSAANYTVKSIERNQGELIVKAS